MCYIVYYITFLCLYYSYNLTHYFSEINILHGQIKPSTLENRCIKVKIVVYIKEIRIYEHNENLERNLTIVLVNYSQNKAL